MRFTVKGVLVLKHNNTVTVSVLSLDLNEMLVVMDCFVWTDQRAAPSSQVHDRSGSHPGWGDGRWNQVCHHSRSASTHSWTCVQNGQSLMSDMGFLLSVLGQSVSPATMCLFYVSVWQVALWSVCLQGARRTTSFVWIVPFTEPRVSLWCQSLHVSLCVCLWCKFMCVLVSTAVTSTASVNTCTSWLLLTREVLSEQFLEWQMHPTTPCSTSNAYVDW